MFPNKIGIPIPSSWTIWAAFNTSNWSASAKTIVLGSVLALFVSNFTILLSPPNRSCKSLAYFSQSVISISATPLSIAAFATAGEMVEINLGSKGFGIM